MGFVYRVFRILKALLIILSETINILWTFEKTKNFGNWDAPENFIIGLCT